MVDADGFNIEDFQSKKKRDWFPTVFVVLLLILLSTVPGKEYGLTKRLEMWMLFGLLQPFCKFYKLGNCYLMFIYLLDFTNIYFLCILQYIIYCPSRTNELKTFAILIYTPLLPEVHPQSFIFTLPQTFLVWDSIWRPANKTADKNIQFNAILDAYRECILLRCISKYFDIEKKLTI